MSRPRCDRDGAAGSRRDQGLASRRRLLSALAAGGLTATAGCLEDAVESVTSYSAAPAVVSPAVVEDTGYEYHDTAARVDTETVAGASVEITYYVSSYVRTIEIPILGIDSLEVGLFGVLSTPDVSVAGREFNPLADASRDELVDQVQQEGVDLEIGDAAGNRTVTGLGEEIAVDTFEGTASFEGQDELEVFLDIAQVYHDGDYLVIVGGTPDDDRLDTEAERERVDTMIGGIEHGDDVDVATDEDAASNGDR
ncbi:hypothetical protein D8Y22_10970 [Salinadaptatus halalkaliphilus]|uniref:Uncharacterized protein n=1 Tax=Salinadaptatus halalkaliphilus TaxID=2419781 RepID=A0A4S3TKX5_9EURY|nr:DUF6517 family protein [Salinadaptatus halalkaliphilus]THE64771.1 hypothetical protein D8Y22_10970 [Salinadaptatus halalkaliphilus]